MFEKVKIAISVLAMVLYVLALGSYSAEEQAGTGGNLAARKAVRRWKLWSGWRR